jgi:hypothetical protein
MAEGAEKMAVVLTVGALVLVLAPATTPAAPDSQQFQRSWPLWPYAQDGMKGKGGNRAASLIRI